MDKLDQVDIAKLWDKLKLNSEYKIITTPRQSGKSWYSQYMTDFYASAWKGKVDFVANEEFGVVCDVIQEVQDWLMREFDPGKMWKYSKFDSKYKPINYGYERVTMLPEVYTALTLRWS